MQLDNETISNIRKELKDLRGEHQILLGTMKQASQHFRKQIEKGKRRFFWLSCAFVALLCVFFADQSGILTGIYSRYDGPVDATLTEYDASIVETLEKSEEDRSARLVEMEIAQRKFFAKLTEYNASIAETLEKHEEDHSAKLVKMEIAQRKRLSLAERSLHKKLSEAMANMTALQEFRDEIDGKLNALKELLRGETIVSITDMERQIEVRTEDIIKTTMAEQASRGYAYNEEKGSRRVRKTLFVHNDDFRELKCPPSSLCEGLAGTGASRVKVHCSEHSRCEGSAFSGNALAELVCPFDSTCLGDALAGNARVRMTCRTGATCEGRAGEGNARVELMCQKGATCTCKEPGQSRRGSAKCNIQWSRW